METNLSGTDMNIINTEQMKKEGGVQMDKQNDEFWTSMTNDLNERNARVSNKYELFSKVDGCESSIK